MSCQKNIKKEIKTSKAPQAIGPYSQAIEIDGFVFISGQIPIDYKTNMFVEDADIVQQTEIVLNNIKAILKKAGLKFDDVVKTEIFLTNIDDFKVVNEIYSGFFDKSPQPARQTVEVANLPLNSKIEISCIAKK